VHQDNNCGSARNGICEDGGTGSSYYIDIDGSQAHLCGYGTDLEDCAPYGPRQILSYGYLSYAGVTNITYPLPPPPPPYPPPVPSPPLNISWQGCVEDADKICYSFSTRPPPPPPGQPSSYADFVCSGTMEQLYWKVARGICNPPTGETVSSAGALSYSDLLSRFLADTSLKQDCSDGGFASVAVRVGSIGFQYSEPTFGCDYGSQCTMCAQSRPYIETLPCQDTCGIGTSNDVITGNPAFNDANASAQKTLRDGTVLYNGALCRDGGAQAASATCLYGTMC
jgi:hypothetical protein